MEHSFSKLRAVNRGKLLLFCIYLTLSLRTEEAIRELHCKELVEHVTYFLLMTSRSSGNQGNSNNTNEQNENEITKQSTEFYFFPVLTGDLSPGGATDSYNMKDKVFQPLFALFVFQAFTGAEGFMQSNMNLDLQL